MPIRNGYARDVFIVTSGEMMALYAASNIVHAIDNFKDRGYARCSGLILNERKVENELELVNKVAGEINTEVVSIVPRDKSVQIAENQGMTVIEALPDSSQAKAYLALAKKVLELSIEDEDEEEDEFS